MPDPDRKTVSATEMSALFDSSPYLTRWMLWHRFANGIEPDDEESSRKDWGLRMQPLLLEQVAEDYRLTVEPVHQYQHRGLIGCTRDAICVDPQRGPGSVETKVVFDYGVWMRNWEGGVPPLHIETQLQAQLHVGDGTKPHDWGVIAALVCGEMKYWEREYKAEFGAQMETAAADFLVSVKDDREPSPYGSECELPLIAKLYPRVTTEELVELDDARLGEAARMYLWAAEERKRMAKVEADMKAQILGTAKEHGRLKVPGAFITIKKSEVAEAQTVRKAHVRTTIKVDKIETDDLAPFKEAELSG